MHTLSGHKLTPKIQLFELKFTIPFVLMGFSSLLIQICILRLLLATFSGNELDIGITLSFWLVNVGLGSFLGQRIKRKNFFTYSFIIISILLIPTVFAIKAIRPILSLQIGEAISLFYIIISTAVIISPICIVLGIQFPLSVLYSGNPKAGGLIYGLEAVGAFVGGLLFTFFISSRINTFDLFLILSLLNILIALYISKKKILLFFLIIPLSLYLFFYPKASYLPWKGLYVSKIKESRYGEITVIKLHSQSSIYLNGHLFYTYPDSPSAEIKTHIPMTLHPSPLNILVIGGSPSTLEEIVKYPLERVDFIEIDPEIINITFDLVSKQDRDILRNPKLNIIIGDGRKFIKDLYETKYDLIFVNLPLPYTANINRFYTIEFFKEAKSALKSDGILVLNLPKSTGYIGRKMQVSNGSIYNSLKSVFDYVEVSAEDYGGIFASMSPIVIIPEVLQKRFSLRKIQTQYFHEYIFYDAFTTFSVDYVKRRLGEIKNINTDLKPSTYLYYLILWSEIYGGKILYYLTDIEKWHVFLVIPPILIVILFLAYKNLSRAIYFSILTTGLSSMAFMVSLILAYQAFYGYIYETIGLLTSTFMLGLWLGTIITKDTRQPLRILFYCEFLTVILAVISILFFKTEPSFFLLILFSGIITGGQFNTANLSTGGIEIAGIIYGIELIGSFIGAFISSIVLIPLVGIYNTLLFVAGTKIFSAFIIYSLLHQK